MQGFQVPGTTASRFSLTVIPFIDEEPFRLTRPVAGRLRVPTRLPEVAVSRAVCSPLLYARARAAPAWPTAAAQRALGEGVNDSSTPPDAGLPQPPVTS